MANATSLILLRQARDSFTNATFDKTVPDRAMGALRAGFGAAIQWVDVSDDFQNCCDEAFKAGELLMAKKMKSTPNKAKLQKLTANFERHMDTCEEALSKAEPNALARVLGIP